MGRAGRPRDSGDGRLAGDKVLLESTINSVAAPRANGGEPRRVWRGCVAVRSGARLARAAAPEGKCKCKCSASARASAGKCRPGALPPTAYRRNPADVQCVLVGKVLDALAPAVAVEGRQINNIAMHPLVAPARTRTLLHST